MLTEEEKNRIRQEHWDFLERRHLELTKRLEAGERIRREREYSEEMMRIKEEIEDEVYKDNPDYIKYVSHSGTTKWILREDFEKKRYRRRKIRKKHKSSLKRKLLEKGSMALIIVLMLVTMYIAFKLVSG